MKGKEGVKWLRERQARRKRNEAKKVLEELRGSQEGLEFRRDKCGNKKMLQVFRGKIGTS
jgi:hypothetical protein